MTTKLPAPIMTPEEIEAAEEAIHPKRAGLARSAEGTQAAADSRD
jgi:hypothetical protein